MLHIQGINGESPRHARDKPLTIPLAGEDTGYHRLSRRSYSPHIRSYSPHIKDVIPDEFHLMHSFASNSFVINLDIRWRSKWTTEQECRNICCVGYNSGNVRTHSQVPDPFQKKGTGASAGIVHENHNNSDCIRCLDCEKVCPVDAISHGLAGRQKELSDQS